MTTIQSLLEISESGGVYDVVLINRGVFDLTAWLRYYYTLGYISDEKLEFWDRFICQEEWRLLEDVVILFWTSPEASVQREEEEVALIGARNKSRQKAIREMHMPNHVNTTSLVKLKDSYLAAYNRHISDFCIFNLETTKISTGELSEKVMEICEPLIINRTLQLRLPLVSL
jgi:hypothetical protein